MLTEPQRHVLEQLGHVACMMEKDPAVAITNPLLHKRTGLDPTVIRVVFKSFHRSGILAASEDQSMTGLKAKAAEYGLTDYGRELLSTMGYLVDSPVEIDSSDDENPIKLNPTTLDLIARYYPKDVRAKTTSKVAKLLGMNILGQNPRERPGKNDTMLWFDSRVSILLGKNGCMAVAHWLDIDPLIYGRRWSSRDIRYMLGVDIHAELGAYVQERYFEPLLTELARNKETS